MRTGIRSVTIARPFRLDELRLCGEMGFGCVELSFNREGSQLDWRDAELGWALRDEAERLGIRLLAHAPEHLWLTSPDRDLVDDAVAELSAIFQGMAAFGAAGAVCHVCGYNAAVPGRQAQQRDNFVYMLGRMAPVCRATGIRLLMETLTPGRVSSDLDAIIRAVDAVGDEWIGICVDTNHLNLTEDLPAAIGRAGRRIAEFHCNDNHGLQEEHLLPFEGIIDWEAFARAVAGIGFDPDLILEPSHYDQARYGSLVEAAADVAEKLAALVRQARGD